MSLVDRQAQKNEFRICDLYWADAKLDIEYDSDFYHVGAEKIAQDANRRNDLESRGITVITDTNKQLLSWKRMDEVACHAAKRIGKRIRQEYRFFSEILDDLGSAGFRPLELTKLVRDELDRYDYMSIRHTGGSCIAIGHGAGGNLENYFYRNSSEIPLISDELRISSAGRIVCPEYRVIDELINDLQKCRADLSAYSSRLGSNLEAVLSFTLQRLESEGLLERKSGMVTLTASGMFWGNNIIDELVGVLLQRRA